MEPEVLRYHPKEYVYFAQLVKAGCLYTDDMAWNSQTRRLLFRYDGHLDKALLKEMMIENTSKVRCPKTKKYLIYVYSLWKAYYIGGSTYVLVDWGHPFKWRNRYMFGFRAHGSQYNTHPQVYLIGRLGSDMTHVINWLDVNDAIGSPRSDCLTTESEDDIASYSF